MKRFLVYLASILLGATGAFGVAIATKDESPKIVICHRTNSVTNPYEKIEVDADAVDGEGNNDHTPHAGPVPTNEAEAQALKDIKTKWGDIIPDILNWDEDGQAIYRNDCQYVVENPDEGDPSDETDNNGTGGGQAENQDEVNESHSTSLPAVGSDGK